MTIFELAIYRYAAAHCMTEDELRTAGVLAGKADSGDTEAAIALRAMVERVIGRERINARQNVSQRAAVA